MMGLIAFIILVVVSVIMYSMLKTAKLSDEECYEIIAMYYAERYLNFADDLEKKLRYLSDLLFSDDAPDEIKKLDAMTKVELDLAIYRILRQLQRLKRENYVEEI